MDLSEGVAQTNNARAPSHSTSAPYVAGGPSQPQTQSSAANLFNNFVTQNPQVLSNGAATSMLPGTGLFGNNKTAGSVTPFAGFGGQAEAKPTNFSTFASVSGLFNARTDTNNKSGGFGSNVTGDGKSVFGSTSVWKHQRLTTSKTSSIDRRFIWKTSNRSDRSTKIDWVQPIWERRFQEPKRKWRGAYFW